MLCFVTLICTDLYQNHLPFHCFPKRRQSGMYYSQYSPGKGKRGKGGSVYRTNYRNNGGNADSKADTERRNIFSHNPKRRWLEGDSKGSDGDQSTTSTVMCPMSPCTSSRSLLSSSICDGGYGSIVCLPREVVFKDVQCEGHLYDLCISSDFVQDALTLGGSCGPCHTSTADDLFVLGPCPVRTRSRSEVGKRGLINLLKMLGSREDVPPLGPSNFVTNIIVNGVPYAVDPKVGVDVVDIKSGAVITVLSDGTVEVDGSKEIVDFCFNYIISSTSTSGDEKRLNPTEATGTHCENVLPYNEYTSTITDIELSPQEAMVGELALRGLPDQWSIEQIVVTDDSTGNSTATSPLSGEGIEMTHGTLTLTFNQSDDSIQKMFAYEPDPLILESLGEGETMEDSFDLYVTSSDGEQTVETVTFVIVGKNDAPNPANDIVVVDEGDEASSCVL